MFRKAPEMSESTLRPLPGIWNCDASLSKAKLLIGRSSITWTSQGHLPPPLFVRFFRDRAHGCRRHERPDSIEDKL